MLGTFITYSVLEQSPPVMVLRFQVGEPASGCRYPLGCSNGFNTSEDRVSRRVCTGACKGLAISITLGKRCFNPHARRQFGPLTAGAARVRDAFVCEAEEGVSHSWDCHHCHQTSNKTPSSDQLINIRGCKTKP